jgi:ABC-type lipoprotein release transport system permease subunit
MTFRDLMAIATGNLWRMKLRAVLTISGVLIAIAAFVSMVSFGAGNQQYIETEFNKLGLFTTMQVYPKRDEDVKDSLPKAKLDREALAKLGAIPGVNLVYPYDAVSVSVTVGDTVIQSKAQALPAAAMKTRLFSQLGAGAAFEDDSALSAVVSDDLLKEAHISNLDSVIGGTIVLTTKVSVIDSGLAHILVDGGESLLDRAKRIRLDSLRRAEYRARVLRGEVSEVVRRFVSGFINAQASVSETLTVCGVRTTSGVGGSRIEDVIMPVRTAVKFKQGGFGGSPTEIFGALSSGTLFDDAADGTAGVYSRVTLDFDPKVPYRTVKDSVAALGFRAFSFAEEFEEIQQVFIYLNMALGLIGLIALSTASLGIANTMIMSINERRREIGVLKSLGADESDIRRLFLVESGVIGLFGTAGGILFGWGITRVASAIAQSFMEDKGIAPIDLFALPLWLIGVSLAVGIGVSVVAGLYPAARAARVDPVEALRNE